MREKWWTGAVAVIWRGVWWWEVFKRTNQSIRFGNWLDLEIGEELWVRVGDSLGWAAESDFIK